MKFSRRDFLKLTGATTGGLLLGTGLSHTVLAGEGVPPYALHKKVGEATTICTYCAVGCGQIAAVVDGRVVNVEGDPDHPINRGSLCSKGAANWQVIYNPRRVTKILYRAPGADKWEEKSWDWALDQIARRIKDTRDKHFVAKDKDGATVNRLEAIAYMGGAQNTNEEVYAWVKAARGLGIVYLEHQARI
jgi:formate dehydrogenase major subunit